MCGICDKLRNQKIIMKVVSVGKSNPKINKKTKNFLAALELNVKEAFCIRGHANTSCASFFFLVLQAGHFRHDRCLYGSHQGSEPADEDVAETGRGHGTPSGGYFACYVRWDNSAIALRR